MTNVGALNATLSLSAFEFNSGLKQSETAALEFATTTEVQSRRANAALNSIGANSVAKSRISQNLTQVGYMIQDFSSQVETRGIGPAIGAISNNLQMMGGPMIAIGAAVGGIILPKFLDWLNNTKAIAEAAKEAQTQFERSAQAAKELATLEVKGGAGKERKNLEDQVAISGKLKQQAAADLITAQRAANAAKAEMNRRSFEVVEGINFRITNPGFTGAQARDAEASYAAAQEALKRHQDHMRSIIAEGAAAQDKLNKIGPGTAAAKTDADIVANKEAEDAHFAQLKKRDELESGMKRKSLEQYGTEAMKTEARIERERKELMDNRVNEETRKRFEAISKIDMARARQTDAEKKLSDMGQAAGSSAGAQRNSAAGVNAINRAVAGRASEQSMQKQQVDSLKRLVKLAEDEAAKSRPKQVALSG